LNVIFNKTYNKKERLSNLISISILKLKVTLNIKKVAKVILLNIIIS